MPTPPDPGMLVLASLLGRALGDALGRRGRVPDAGRDPIGLPRRRADARPPARFTDDTRMTLFTAEGLIAASARRSDPIEEVHRALLRWLVTQAGRPAVPAGEGRLLCRPAPPPASGRRARRASRHLEAAPVVGGLASNDSKGCGDDHARVAPLRLRARPGRERARPGPGDVVPHAWPRHGCCGRPRSGPGCCAPCGGGAEPEAAARALLSDLRRGETAAAVAAALDAPRDGRAETAESLGGGWVAEEALAIGLHAALTGARVGGRASPGGAPFGRFGQHRGRGRQPPGPSLSHGGAGPPLAGRARGRRSRGADRGGSLGLPRRADRARRGASRLTPWIDPRMVRMCAPMTTPVPIPRAEGAPRLAVAPMMDWTDTHCRVLHRLMSRRTLLYTEMVTAPALVRGGARRLLRFDPSEHPVACQLGGCDPGRAGARRPHGRGGGLRRGEPQRRLPLGPGPVRRVRGGADAAAGARGRVRGRDARRRPAARDGQVPDRRGRPGSGRGAAGVRRGPCATRARPA